MDINSKEYRDYRASCTKVCTSEYDAKSKEVNVWMFKVPKIKKKSFWK